MIYTSYFTMANKIPSTLRKLSITSSKKITLDGCIDALAPSWRLVFGYKNGTISQAEYVEQYNAQLAKLDPAIVPDNSVLFCFEKPGDFCHRHLVAAWLRQHGIPCVEYGTTALERLQQTVAAATTGIVKCGATDVGGAQHTVQQVPAFRGERFYLSNMYEYPMDINGMEFSCVEAAFQSFKTKDLELRKKFVGLNGYEAKKLGRRIALREDWDQVKVKVMRQLIQCKFSLELGDKLAKEQGELVETNTWGDTFWGVCNGVGQNWLGKLLMQVRDQKQSSLLYLKDQL